MSAEHPTSMSQIEIAAIVEPSNTESEAVAFQRALEELERYETEKKEEASRRGISETIPETALELPIPHTRRSITSDSAHTPLVPTAYKRYHVDNPPIPVDSGSLPLYRLAAAIMMRDEEQYIRKTIDSAAPFVDCFVFLDTGSVDASIETVRKACEEHAKPCFIMEINWIMYGPSRNHLMSFVERIARFALLLDTSDEVIHGEQLNDIVQNWPDSCERYTVALQWGQYRHMYPRLVNTAYQLRYVGKRHNYIAGGGGLSLHLTGEQTSFCLYQDRLAAKSSANKYRIDAFVLLREHLDHPEDRRTVFYLAQSYRDSGDPWNAYRFYKKRAAMGGWVDEAYMSHYRCAHLAKHLKLGYDVSHQHLLDAFELVASPYCAIALYRMCADAGRKNEACAWITLACRLPDHQVALEGDSFEYSYKRWALLGYASCRMGLYHDAVDAYVQAHRADLESEAMKLLRRDSSAEIKADRNSVFFDYVWKASRGQHPDLFIPLPQEWFSEALRTSLKNQTQK